MYHDDTIGLAALREQYKKDERLRGPAEGARATVPTKCVPEYKSNKRMYIHPT